MPVSIQNVSGGVTLLFEGEKKEDLQLIFEEVLEPNETLFLDDRHLWHYTSPVMPKIPNHPATRDVFVFTLRADVPPSRNGSHRAPSRCETGLDLTKISARPIKDLSGAKPAVVVGDTRVPVA